MGTRAINPAARYATLFATGAVLAGAFGFLFLSTAPVKGISDLYWGLHFDRVMPLNKLFGLGHVIIYAALTVILGRFTRTAEGWLIIIVSLTALGLGVEIAQGLGGARTFELEDMFANFVGVCAGFFLLVVLGPPLTRRRRKR